MEKANVQQAVNVLIQEGSKITVANCRRKLIELFGYAGNNNDLAPLVKAIKQELKQQVRQQAGNEDVDETIATAINKATTIEMPSELEANGIKFLRYVYQEIYNSIDGEIDNEMVNQLQQEIELIKNQERDYPKVVNELAVVRKYYEEALIELRETNRLLDLQKVAEGQEKIGEIERVTELYETATNELVEQKARAEYATNQKNTISKANQELRETVKRKDNRIIELEAAILQLTSENPQIENTEREELLENRLTELLRENNRLQNEIADNKLEQVSNTLEDFIEVSDFRTDVLNTNTKVGKFVRDFNNYLKKISSEEK